MSVVEFLVAVCGCTVLAVLVRMIVEAIRQPRQAKQPAVTREQLAKVAGQLRYPDAALALADDLWRTTPADQRQWWLDYAAEILTHAGITVAPSPSPRAKTKDTRHDL